MRRKIRVGLDFDGVIAYNPFRVIRYPVSLFKRYLFGVKKLRFWYPKTRWQQIFWIILHESSIWPANGIELFKELVDEDTIEAHLITARYSFLDEQLFKWLQKHRLTSFFKTINLNKQDEQPHLFKEKMIRKYKLDYFVEDNLDIVNYLEKKVPTKIFWIYNIMDRLVEYPHKFPYLESALQMVIKT